MTADTIKKSVYDIATERIIQLLEAGTASWRRPWSAGGYGATPPQNFRSRRAYRGLNFFLLQQAETPYFLTYRQARERGGHVRRGASAWPVFFWKIFLLDADGKRVESEREAAKRVPMLRYFQVFNSADIGGIDFPEPEKVQDNDLSRIDVCEGVIRGSGARFVQRRDGRAAYSPAKDQIGLPPLNAFDSSEDFYATAFHELGHWTGHPDRLARFRVFDPEVHFGSESYSREELVAEMSSAFLCAHCGIDSPPVVENAAAYLRGWLDRLRADNRLVVTAATQAQRAADFVLAQRRA